MNVDEVELYPGLGAEREWLAEAVTLQMPILGICLGPSCWRGRSAPR